MVRVGVGSLRVCEVKPPHVEYAAAAAADDDDGYADSAAADDAADADALATCTRQAPFL